MTMSAWILMIATWSVITYFTARYFLAVLRATERREEADEG